MHSECIRYGPQINHGFTITSSMCFSSFRPISPRVLEYIKILQVLPNLQQFLSWLLAFPGLSCFRSLFLYELILGDWEILQTYPCHPSLGHLLFNGLFFSEQNLFLLLFMLLNTFSSSWSLAFLFSRKWATFLFCDHSCLLYLPCSQVHLTLIIYYFICYSIDACIALVCKYRLQLMFWCHKLIVD